MPFVTHAPDLVVRICDRVVLLEKGRIRAEGRPQEVVRDFRLLMTREDLAKFHDTWFKPNNATLLVVGDTTLAEIKPKLEKLFASWKPGEVPRKSIPEVQQPGKNVVYLCAFVSAMKIRFRRSPSHLISTFCRSLTAESALSFAVASRRIMKTLW